MNIKRIASFIGTWFILYGAAYSLTRLKKGNFFGYIFFLGLIGVMLIKFSSSSGDFTSDNLDMHLQS